MVVFHILNWRVIDLKLDDLTVFGRVFLLTSCTLMIDCRLNRNRIHFPFLVDRLPPLLVNDLLLNLVYSIHFFSYFIRITFKVLFLGSSTRSGFWHKSAIPVPIIEPKLKLRHSNTSIVSTSGPLIAKR